MLSDFIVTANAIAGTTRKLQKERLLADYFVLLDDESLERAAVFFTGSPFPRRDQRVTGVGSATIAEAAAEAAGATVEELWAAWPGHADLGDTVAGIYERAGRIGDDDVTLSQIADTFDRLAATPGTGGKRSVLAGLFRKVGPQGARYVVKMLQNEMRIGLQEGLVESAIARAFDRPLEAVRRANMFTGDIGVAALLARSGTLDSAAMTLFHPFAFMLAQPEEAAADIFATVGPGSYADDKYDGIRAQIHRGGDQVRIYSRTLDDVTHRFPEIEAAARTLGSDVILDGEIIAFSDRALPFAVIQKRLGRRKVSEKLLADAPVIFVAFDLLYRNGEPLFEKPLRERVALLQAVVSGGTIRLCDRIVIERSDQIDPAFDAARARANEGLVLKSADSVYTPGRRGRSWLKYKKALATLDCVVTYAQWGNGKRRGVLSDLTFAVRRDGELVNIGKAYSGLTDAEIAMLTERFRKGEWLGWGFRVPPDTVLEIAFDRIQESKRHKAGYAMRFPRIARIRDDKTVEEISTIDDVRRIYEGQLKREGGE